MFSQSLLNKYQIFKEMPEDSELDTPAGIHHGVSLDKGMLWLLKLVGNFQDLNDSKPLMDCYELPFALLKEHLIHAEPHVFRVEKDIVGLIQKTDSEIKYIPCPFHDMFIDGEINISEDVKLYGLFLKDNRNLTVDWDNRTYEKEKMEDNIIIMGMIKARKDNKFTLVPYVNVIGLGKGIIYSRKEAQLLPRDIHKKVKSFVCSFLNFLNHPDVEIMDTTYSETERSKQRKKGRFPKRSLRSIKVTGKVRKYLDSLKNAFDGNIDWTHSFWVRGHFMHLTAERYKKKKVVWRMPHIKGRGNLVKKDYELKARR